MILLNFELRLRKKLLSDKGKLMTKLQLIFVLVVTTFIACKDEVVLLQELDQRNTNEIMVVLSRNGIKARKQAIEKQQTVSWSVFVRGSDEPRAREILVDHNLPKQRELGLSGICKDAGMIPTPKTEKCREMLALKGEIINSLRAIPGVVNADVVLNMPDKDEFADDSVAQARPSASVVVQVAAKSNQTEFITESKVQQFVANTVPSMDMRDVAVIISRVEAPFEAEMMAEEKPTNDQEIEAMEAEDMVSIGGLTMDAKSAKKFKTVAIIFLVVFVISSAGLVLIVLMLGRSRQQKNAANKKGTEASSNQAFPAGAPQVDQILEGAPKGQRA